MQEVVLVNGKQQSVLSVFNRLTQFGDGLFETCVVQNSQLLFWSSHFKRLEQGRVQLKINPVNQQIWMQDIKVALKIANTKNAVVKIMLSRGQSIRGYGFEPNIEPTRIVIVSKPPKLPNTYTLEVCHSGYANNQHLANIKHCNRLEQILARSALHADECIMLDENHHVISVTQGNIFALKDDMLLTPNLDQCGIKGTRRDIVLKIADVLDLQTNITILTLPELLQCDEVFITNSVIGIKPVTAIDATYFTQQTFTQKFIQVFHDIQQ